jgi:programmed cell death 6-interacting protein
MLHSLNLPSSLEALERPVGLPPSLLKKAEEVRRDEGPRYIESSIEDVQRLAHQDMALLNEVRICMSVFVSWILIIIQAMDILDNEASEDEAARKTKRINRLPSHEANLELVEKERKYRAILDQAAESDELVRKKWDEWEACIVELTWEEVWSLLSRVIFSQITLTVGRS